MFYVLPVLASIVAFISIFIAPRVRSEGSFFKGQSLEGQQPSLLTLTFSQVTTWIFARSLLNAAILGYFYGIWGALAYATYYLSFLTGGKIIDSVRFRHGFDSIQSFLYARFGSWGTLCYNFVVGLRLISEVFANLLAIGILFGETGSTAYSITIIAFAGITLFYTLLGGMRASLKTDVFQMGLFMVILSILLFLVMSNSQFSLADLGFMSFAIDQPGPVLMMVAFLQVWSYPMHDPVMMDRGFLSDRETTRKSFYHAAWISLVSIILFGSIGVLAGAHALEGESMNTTLIRLLGEIPMLFFNAALIISAMSTLDSTLSSSAKLVASDMRVIPMTIRNGRLVMSVFMLLGILLVFLGNKDLFSAVAVSGTASMYLAPVIFFSLWGGRTDIPIWSYVLAFLFAIAGAILYFFESSQYSVLLGDIHKYTKLLYICVGVLVMGCLSFWLGGQLNSTKTKMVIV